MCSIMAAVLGQDAPGKQGGCSVSLAEKIGFVFPLRGLYVDQVGWLNFCIFSFYFCSKQNRIQSTALIWLLFLYFHPLDCHGCHARRHALYVVVSGSTEVRSLCSVFYNARCTAHRIVLVSVGAAGVDWACYKGKTGAPVGRAHELGQCEPFLEGRPREAMVRQSSFQTPLTSRGSKACFVCN